MNSSDLKMLDTLDKVTSITKRNQNRLPLTVGILIFDQVEVLDVAGPFEVFAITRLNEGRRQEESSFRVLLLSENMDQVSAIDGLRFIPDATIDKGKPGLLDKREATTHWRAFDFLREAAPTALIRDDVQFTSGTRLHLCRHFSWNRHDSVLSATFLERRLSRPQRDIWSIHTHKMTDVGTIFKKDCAIIVIVPNDSSLQSHLTVSLPNKLLTQQRQPQSV